MYLIHEPADGPAERYDLDEMAAAEAEAVERTTGMKWPEIEQALQQQSPTALRAVLWVWRKREQPTLRYAEFDVPGWRKRLKIRLGADEVAQYVRAVDREFADDDASHAQALRELEEIADDPAEVQRAAEAAAPKAVPAPAEEPPLQSSSEAFVN